MIARDIDKDGLIRIDGFKAALLAPEFGLKVEEVIEIFQLIQRDGFF